MSLINQMLNDLEKRQAGELKVNNGTLQGVNRYVANNGGGQSGLVLGIIIALVILLTILVGYLLWDRYTNSGSEKVLASAVAAPTETGPPVKQPTRKVISKKSVATSKTTSGRKSAEQGRKSTVAPHETSRTNNNARVEPIDAPTDIAEDDGEASDRVHKQHRSLTPSQQAGVLYQQAYANLKAGQASQAEDQLRQALDIEPRYSRARELLAGSYIRSGRYVEAGKLLQQGLRVEAKNFHFAKLYARVLMQQNRQKQALEMLVRHRPALQTDQEYFALIAALYQQTGQHQQAINMYKDLLNLQPGRGLWWVGLGISLEKTRRPNEAQQAYQRATDSGSLNANMRRYTDNKLAALKESGYPTEETEQDTDLE